jgi:hypothetical protein
MNNQFFRGRRSGGGGLGGGQGAGQSRGEGAGRGRGRGGGNKPGSGPGGSCVCPKCGHHEPHIVGQRCLDQSCPKCGTKMTRE